MDIRIEHLTRIAAVTLLVIGCLLVLQPFVTALLCAAIVCFSTWPFYEWMVRGMRGRSSLAALMMTMLLILLFVLPLALLALTLADTATPAIDWLRETFVHGLPLPPDWVRDLPIVGDSLDAGWRDLATNKAKLAEAMPRDSRLALPGPSRFPMPLTGDHVDSEQTFNSRRLTRMNYRP